MRAIRSISEVKFKWQARPQSRTKSRSSGKFSIGLRAVEGGHVMSVRGLRRLGAQGPDSVSHGVGGDYFGQ